MHTYRSPLGDFTIEAADGRIVSIRYMRTARKKRGSASDRTVRQCVRQLDEYLRFRHLFRNIYGFELEWERCRELFSELPIVLARLEQQFAAFDEFLGTLEQGV